MKYHIGELSCLSICHQIKVPITLSFGFGIGVCSCVCMYAECFVSRRDAKHKLPVIHSVYHDGSFLAFRSFAQSQFNLSSRATANSLFSLFGFVAINLFCQFDSKFARAHIHTHTVAHSIILHKKDSSAS